MARHISRALLRVVSAVTGAFLSLFFAMCHAVEYGCPSADYKIGGTVRTAGSQQPLANVGVALYEAWSQDTSTSGPALVGPDTTDTAGRFSFDFNWWPPDQTVLLRACDADSTANGLYLQRDTVFTILKSELSGGDGNWYAGQVDKTIDIELDSAGQ